MGRYLPSIPCNKLENTMHIQITLTHAVNCILTESKNGEFREFLNAALTKFLSNDWGIASDKTLNDSEPMCAMGVYATDLCDERKIWIKSDDYRESGQLLNGQLLERVITVMLPSDY